MMRISCTATYSSSSNLIFFAAGWTRPTCVEMWSDVKETPLESDTANWISMLARPPQSTYRSTLPDPNRMRLKEKTTPKFTCIMAHRNFIWTAFKLWTPDRIPNINLIGQILIAHATFTAGDTWVKQNTFMFLPLFSLV